MLLMACGSKKKSEDIITHKVVKTVPKEPVRMQEYTDVRDVEWLGASYHVAIRREPDDSLGLVKDETGQKFVDNMFTLNVSRADGTIFYGQVFTKEMLAQYLDDNFRKTGIFEGLVFDRAEGDFLIFAASVGHPQTDEYIPLVISLSSSGKISIRRDTQLDTLPESFEDGRSGSDEDGV